MANAIVLAGGKSSRFGSDKAFAKVRGIAIIEYLLLLLSPLFNRVIIVSNLVEKYERYNVKIVSDKVTGTGPLGGIYSGLVESDLEKNFVIACDMPLVSLNLIKHMLSFDGYDAVIPKIDEKVEPLCAVYSKNSISEIEKQITMGDLKVRNLYKKIKTKYLEEEEIKNYDPELKSFFNVNLREDLKEAEACLKI